MECELQRFGQCLCDSRPLAWVFLDATWVNLLILRWGFWNGFFGWLMIFTVFGRIMKIVKTTISLEWILLIIGSWGWWTHGKEAFYSDPRSTHGSTTICLLFFVCKVVSIRTVLWYMYIFMFWFLLLLVLLFSSLLLYNWVYIYIWYTHIIMHIVENSNPVNFIAVFWNLKPLHKKFAWSAEVSLVARHKELIHLVERRICPHVASWMGWWQWQTPGSEVI